MRQRSLFWWLFAISFMMAGLGLAGLLLAMAVFPENGWLRWIFGPLWFLGAPFLIGVTIAWVATRIGRRLRAKANDRPVNTQLPSKGQRSSGKKALSPVQIGGCAGAAATCLILLVVRDLTPPVGGQGAVGGEPFPSPVTFESVTLSSDVLLGVWSAVGSMAGMAVVALISMVRRKRDGVIPREDSRQARFPAPDASDKKF